MHIGKSECLAALNGGGRRHPTTDHNGSWSVSSQKGKGRAAAIFAHLSTSSFHSIASQPSGLVA